MFESFAESLKTKPRVFSALALLGLSVVPQVIHAAFTYPGCADVKESDFKYQALIGNTATVSGLRSGAATEVIAKPLVVDPTFMDPIHLAFDLQAGNKANVYWIERRSGTIKLYDAVANSVSVVGVISGVSGGGERGLTGIALDPNFKTNKFIFVFYTATSPAEFRISRFTVGSNGKLTAGSESILMHFPWNGQNHTGGAMAFDDRGDLFVTVGKNAKDYPNAYYERNADSSTEATSSNLNDYRGGVLRIHPTADGKYTVPPGNFSEYFSNYFKENGNTTLATEYADPKKVKPELYVKGTRNAYSIAVEPVKHLLAWGEFGINTNGTSSEEHNLVSRPVFGGYPYFTGGYGGGAGTGYYELWKGTGADQFKEAHGSLTESISAPTNESKWNTGPKTMPPVTPALHTYKHEPWGGAVTGPIFRYNAATSATYGLPPHFDGAWFVTDWQQGDMPDGFKGAIIYKLNSTFDQKTDSLYWWQKLGWVNPLSFDQGPDGALYIINYACGSSGKVCEDNPATHIGRLEYRPPAGTAACVATAVKPNQTRPSNGLKVNLESLEVLAAERSTVSIRDSEGREVFSASQQGPHKYALGEKVLHTKGVYLVTLRSTLGIQTVKVTRL